MIKKHNMFGPSYRQKKKNSDVAADKWDAYKLSNKIYLFLFIFF